MRSLSTGTVGTIRKAIVLRLYDGLNICSQRCNDVMWHRTVKLLKVGSGTIVYFGSAMVHVPAPRMLESRFGSPDMPYNHA